MNADKLMDAIGMVDDRFLTEEPKRGTVSVRRKLIVLVAAVVVLSLSVGSVMAATQEFPQLGEKIEKLGNTIQQALFSVFHIETHEKPPAGSAPATEPSTDGTQPPGPALEKIDVVNIDGVVNAHYFAGEGYIQLFEGGFYTYSKPEENSPPANFSFWEIRKEGIVEVNTKRSELTFLYDGRQLRIIFDHALINGKLCVMVWPEGLNENTYLNGWNVEAIGDRTDVVLMSIPVMTGDDISHHYFLLNMENLETVPLLESISTDNMIVDYCSVTALTGLELENAKISASPNGRFILIGYQERAKDEKTSWCYPKIGLLDPQKEEMKLLNRDISGNAEYLRGWLDDQTVVITTGRNEDGDYYVLVYEFIE